MKILILGSTGLVGKNILELALRDPRITHVVAPVRKSSKISHQKLSSPVIDFDNVSESSEWIKVDSVLCALGTTIKKASSQLAFEQVDLIYPEKFAKLAYKNGAKSFVLNSALGADSHSKVFYNRTKGKVEERIKSIGFSSLTIARPGIIGGQRDEFRLGEEIAKKFMGLLGGIIPKRYRINHAPEIARQMLESALTAAPGVHIISSEMMAE